MSSLFIFGNPTFATDPFLNVAIANSISLDLKPISTTGTFAKSDTASSTISATTNYFAGYTLGIAASSDEADAANLVQTSGEGNEQTIIGRISSIGTVEGVTSAGITEQAFSGNSNIQYNNTWGYTLTKLSTSESTNYLPAPTTTTPITLDATDTANPETANNYNMAIGARVGTDIPKGSYTNTFVITAVANPIPYEITFNKGNAEEGTVSNLPDDLGSSTNDTIVTLPNTVPTRTGRKFLGWCSMQPVETDNIDSCSGTTYNPNGDGSNLAYTLNQTTSNTNITLYAMWRPYMVTWDSNYSGTNLPDSTVTYGTVTTLPTITKPNTQCNGADCYTSFKEWNVKADGTGAAVTTGITPTDDITYYAIWNFNANTLQATTNTSASCAGTKYDARDGKAYGVNYITSGNSSFCFILSNLAVASGMTLKTGDSDIKAGGVTYIDPNTNKSVTKTSFTLPTEAWASADQDYYCKAIMTVGNQNGEYFYNWYAAIANPYQCSDPTSDTDATLTNDGYALGSICPAGWALLTYGSGDLEIKNSTFRTALVNNGSLNTVGNFYSGSQRNVGSGGYWWSSTRYANNHAWYLTFWGTGNSCIDSKKFYGLSVRCMRSG
ncbi:InlB B-repeat-containing protein [Candidatus Saccharibacteria bacterium]|nr:InlB B-repeat-containing protein [Candidatus Saccharibacteria bacterium]